jgi:Poly(ADP-ribose) polymerase and DNA-Ligase Zn-finger region
MHIGPAVGYPVAVAHLFELAASGRSKCRGCNQPIRRGELRFGERLPNPFGGGEMTLWFHPLCAAYKTRVRPCLIVRPSSGRHTQASRASAGGELMAPSAPGAAKPPVAVAESRSSAERGASESCTTRRDVSLPEVTSISGVASPILTPTLCWTRCSNSVPR